MRTLQISDITMTKGGTRSELSLSFREKLELCRMLDKLGVSSIETPVITNRRTDGLLLKSIASAIQQAVLTVPVSAWDADSLAYTWSCLQEARHPRLQVSLPVSTVQMEYLYAKKPDAMLSLIESSVRACKAVCEDVEFSAADAGRADWDFLLKAFRAAADAGATTITFCDTAGNRLPQEMYTAIRELRGLLGDGIHLGVQISNEIYMAESCALYAVQAGADEVKVAAFGEGTVSLQKLATAISLRGDDLGVCTGIHMTELQRCLRQIEWICKTDRSKTSPFDNGVREQEGESFRLSVHDDQQTVLRAAKRLGYELNPDDANKVYEAFVHVADKKDSITARELDVLIATSALQVPPTYQLESYVINSGNLITSTSHVRLRKDDAVLTGICIGDGPIDASFLAIEQIAGTHYELDDFQIRAVTEGREAMGEAIVRLRSGGKLYSGRGISTDIVGSSIRAYINALNKIVYEENET